MAVNDFNPSTYTTLSTLLGETNSAAGQVKVNTTFFSPSRFLFKESDVTDAEMLENISRLKKRLWKCCPTKHSGRIACGTILMQKGMHQNFSASTFIHASKGCFFTLQQVWKTFRCISSCNFMPCNAGLNTRKCRRRPGLILKMARAAGSPT